MKEEAVPKVAATNTAAAMSHLFAAPSSLSLSSRKSLVKTAAPAAADASRAAVMMRLISSPLVFTSASARSMSAEESVALLKPWLGDADLSGSPLALWGDKEWLQLGVEMQNWSLSQFMHGEQGALICTAKIVETVPWIDAKYYAATQVMDEARHVEVFAKYLDTKLDGHYPINPHLGLLLDDIIEDSRWDMTYLGMQVMVEGLALAAFGFARQATPDPLLQQLLRYVMADEARHVAFGVLTLREFYEDLTSAELLERQEFAFEAAVRMRDRFVQQEVWQHYGIDPREIIPVLHGGDRSQDPFQQLLFSKIVPNCKKLGLLDANDGWLRARFDTLGVTQFEDWADTSEEYLDLDAVTADRVG